MHRIAATIGAFVFISGLAGSVATRAEVISVPPLAPSEPAASLPPPTVLRGSPPSPANQAPLCQPGYTLSPGYGCLGPNAGDYAESGSGYDYWPDDGFGYPVAGFFGLRHGGGRLHRFAKVRGPAGFHGRPEAHGFSTGIGTMAGFGRR